MVPNEPKVYFLVAKIYKAMGDRAKATQNFTLALNFDPKMMHVVKTAIERADFDPEITMTTTSNISGAINFNYGSQSDEDARIHEQVTPSSIRGQHAQHEGDYGEYAAYVEEV